MGLKIFQNLPLSAFAFAIHRVQLLLEGQDAKYPEKEIEMNAKIQESKKVRTIRRIVKLYFYAALAGSFSHIVSSAYILGAEVWYEAWATPLLIDGLAVIGMIMRSDGPDGFSKRTNKIGFILQCVMGSFSLTMNVIAGLGQSLFGVLFGVALVACFILAEWLKDNLESSEVDTIREAEATVRNAAAYLATCTHPTTCTSAAQCDSKKKAQKTRTKKARQAKAQAKMIHQMTGI